MTRPSLAGIEQRAAAATEEPWVVNGPDEDWAVIHSGPDSVIHAYTAHDPDCERCTCGGDEAGHVAISVEDAAFIARARTAVPALVAAVRDVLARHQPYTIWAYDDVNGVWIYDEHCERVVVAVACCECTSDASIERLGDCEWTEDDPIVVHPCPTVSAITAHLDLTDTEGDPT